MSIMSLSGRFSISDIMRDLLDRLFGWKDQQTLTNLALFAILIFLVLSITYFRPAKIKSRLILNQSKFAKSLKVITSGFLFYSAFAIIIAYYITKF